MLNTATADDLLAPADASDARLPVELRAKFMMQVIGQMAPDDARPPDEKR